MKILLLGEYSGFHNNLREGLEALGHQVDLFGRRDGFKKLSVDIDLDFQGKSPLSALRALKERCLLGHRAPSYDVVQIINSVLFMDMPIINEIIMADLLNRSKNVFLSACGTDPTYLQFAGSRMRYTPIPDWLKEDKNSRRHPLDWGYYRKWHSYVCSKVRGIVPTAYDYSVCYGDQFNVRRTIPLPINTKRYLFKPNVVEDKIVVLHGIIRPGFKGTKHILSAFKMLDYKYPGKFEFVSEGNLPLDEYLSVMERANIVVDQANSYSYGMNAIQALAMGKVVLSGMEPEAMKDMGVTQSPIVNIEPRAEQIASALERVAIPDELAERGIWSRQYVEDVHDAKRIAQLYVNEWHS